ncbi:MAG: orotidine-5'-phosphate decarboxylase [Thermoanaerobaculia bacterium]
MSPASGPLAAVAVALDTGDWETFRAQCALFGPRVGVLKVGLEAYTRWGPAAVEEARRSGARIFLDLKLHDIPNTVLGAVRAAKEHGVDFLTVHAGGGRRMLAAAAEGAGGTLRLLAVTVLTHLDAAGLAELDLPGGAPERAVAWARLAREAGCHGAVCSPRELGGMRSALPPPFVLVTPGIRGLGSVAGDDQRRVATPETALADGSDLLVIGRPLTAAEDPSAALAELAARLARRPATR